MNPASDMISPPLAPRPRRATTAAPPSLGSSSCSSRRPSQPMGPAMFPYGQNVPGSPPFDHDSSGAGPLRHPKPLTPSDLHSMLEKEQEAIVNRLSRELSTLRQQTASVASTTSSTSTTFNESGDPHPSAHATPSSRHRSSSSLSSYIPAVQGSRTRSVSGVAPPRDASVPPSRPSADLSRSTRSREASITSHRQSDGGSLSSSLPRGNSFSQPPATISRFEEAAHHRGELESIKRENEVLRQRVRDLESTVKTYRERPGGTDATTNETNRAAME